MSYPTTFASLTAGNQPLSLFDTMFNVTGQQGNLPCTASGSNTITLTPNTNYYLPAAYTNGQIVSFKAVATSSGSVTAQIGGLGFVKLFTAAGVQAASGDIVNNTHYAVQYWSDLDSGGGGLIILNGSGTAGSVTSNPVQGSFKNLKITNGGTPNTQVALTADAVVVQNGSGGATRVGPVSVTISTGTTGANALDTGTVANSTWYFVYVIFNSSSVTIAGLLSLSSTAPTLPSGYTFFCRLGAVITDSSANLMRTLQYGRRAQYRVTAATNTTDWPLISNANTSNVATAEDITPFVPTTASEIYLKIHSPNVDSISVGPTIATNASMLVVIAQQTVTTTMILETTTVSWSTNSANNTLQCYGWTDNI